MSNRLKRVVLHHPSRWQSLLAGIVSILFLGILQLGLFPHIIVPLNYALPMLICFWTRSRRMLWSMAVIFTVMAGYKIFQTLPKNFYSPSLDWTVYGVQLFNIVITGAVIHLILNLRDSLEQKNNSWQEANKELEAANEELIAREEEIRQQNEELQSQSEELTERNEELQSQSEEMEQQTEELQVQAQELQTAIRQVAQREEMLQMLLLSTNSTDPEPRVMEEVCRRGMRLMGEDVIAAAVVTAASENLAVQAHVGMANDAALHDQWQVDQSLARLVMKENRIASLEDITLRPDLLFPRPNNGQAFRSVLAAPLSLRHTPSGAIEFYAYQARPWTEDQFRLAEWLAAQCSLILETLRLRKNLQESEQRYRSLFESMTEGFALHEIVCDENGQPSDYRFLEINPAFERLTGLKRQDVIGKLKHEILPNDDPRWIEIYGKVALTGQPTHFENFSPVLNRHYEVFAYCPAPRQFAVLFMDVSHRKQMEQALRQGEEQFRTLANSIPQLAWMAKPDGYIFWYNQRWHDYTGTTAADMEGWGWQSVHDPAELPRIVAKWKESLASGEPWEDTFPLRRHDGQMRWHLSRALPVRNSNGQVVLWFGTNTDVTEQLQTQEELHEAKEAAETANQAKDHFLAVLSHELRTPLSPVLMAASIMQEDPELPERLRDDVAMIRRNIELEARLIDDMLDLTRIVRGKLTLTRDMVDVRDILQHTIETCQTEAQNKGISLHVKIEASNTQLYADATRLQQVFWNLLKNAIKFTPQGGSITIRSFNKKAASGNDSLVIQVEDTGEGIDPTVLPLLFTAFEQGGQQTTRRFGGLGLGLVICKSLVQMHGGTIAASSDGLGRGAIFTVELNLTPPHEAESRLHPRLNNSADQIKFLRILLVEDHESTAKITARLLRKFGHSVRIADSVQQALAVFEQEAFDLVLSDLGLPDGSGCDLLPQLLARRSVKAIAMSGYGMESDIQKTRAAGFMEHLVKPVNVQQLEAAISRVAGI